MKNLNPFFVIGTIGMVITALLHMFVTLFLTSGSNHSSFLALYPSFLAFLALGSTQIYLSRSSRIVEPD